MFPLLSIQRILPAGSRGLHAALVVSLLAGVAGCARPHETQDERIRRQAADDARQVRHDAEIAGLEARKAAQQAGRQARDIVEGVKQGWQQGDPASGDHAASKLDLNAASAAELSALPGISPALARKIVRKQPYKATEDLVTRGLLTQAQYDGVSNRLRVRRDDDR